MKKPKIIIWGYPLHSHTHSYIHGSWYKTFKYLGYDTYWFDDQNYPTNFDYSNSMFITEGYADNNIPINKSSTYFVHICVNPEKYLTKGSRLIDIRFNVSQINDCNYSYSVDTTQLYKIGECAFYDGVANDSVLSNKFQKQISGYEALYLSWATDLLPHEFNESDIYMSRENTVYWVGSISESNQSEIKKFIISLNKENIKFVHNNPWTNPLSWEDAKRLTQLSYIAPDIRGSAMRAHVNGKVDTGSNHKLIGYIPCRIFKNISYGQLGITNSKAVNDLFGGLALYSDDEENLLNISKQHIHNTQLIKEQMDFVKNHHTYINRAQALINLYNKNI